MANKIIHTLNARLKASMRSQFWPLLEYEYYERKYIILRYLVAVTPPEGQSTFQPSTSEKQIFDFTTPNIGIFSWR